LYLLAKEIPKSNLFTNWKGREGKFVRTFGMNSKRNKNEWRATWESIKKYIHTALEYPGIEYEVCRSEGCDLDHVEADTFEENVAKQKPFERTKIIDYILDEEKESADLIHEVFDDDFWEKLQKREIKYVSPLIWPLANGVKILGQGRAGLPIIDTNAWKFVHDAFLKNNPAYGDDTATVKTMCDGKNCDVKLLSGKLSADTTIANQENISHLQEVPLLYKHKGQLILLSASKCVQEIIKKKKDAGIEIDDQALAIAYSECSELKEGKKAKSSFKTCTCESNQIKMGEDDSLKKENEDLKAKLAAQEEKVNTEKSHEARKGRYAKLFANVEDAEREKMVASLKANEDDKDDLKAAMEVDDDMKKAKKGMHEDPEKKAMQARISEWETEKKETMITDLKALKAKNGLNPKEVNEYHAGLKGKTYNEILSKYEDNKFEIKGMKASSITPEVNNDIAISTGDMSGLKGKTFDQIAEMTP